jgi:hypothetical protein
MTGDYEDAKCLTSTKILGSHGRKKSLNFETEKHVTDRNTPMKYETNIYQPITNRINHFLHVKDNKTGSQINSKLAFARIST